MNQNSNRSFTPPRHVAIIMDGNGRWAVNKGLERLAGHQAGLKNIPEVINYLTDAGVAYITLFSFSTENWKRPAAEVSGLLKLLAEALEETTRKLDEHNVVIRHLGRLDRLPPGLKHGINRVVEKTHQNTGAVAGFAFDYGGRTEIIEAGRKAIRQGIKPDDLDETTFGRLLDSAGMPDVDLVIRTGGEQRLSNFLLWQSAYAELYFTDTLWPDFNDQEIEKALTDYAGRQRRFGGLQPQ
ncbi:MAG: polyprenyl diphosphate synthase [Dehalogenimonas sp.]|jgi:undecaprenyl diphosphate synthase|uniref:Isoprenyl transferase n=1 Tax=Candidatus Dehalogenimonas loeffleri TaxID=3127115 RepID=A0ABZ2J6H4_9CHLR|nr:polyprenyl diphosphate synthase [Dehalogenimonas sp.]